MRRRAVGARGLALLLFAVACGAGCASSGIGPETVAPRWATQALEREPDAVFSLDVAAMRRDPFFGPLSQHMLQDDRGGELTALRSATRIDLFATVGRTWSAVIRGVPDPPATLLARRWPGGGARVGPAVVYEPTTGAADGVWLTVRPGSWVLSVARPRPEERIPDAVDMDGRAIFEAWLGPNAIAEGLAHARPEAQQALRYLQAARVTVDGGDAPGMALDARFVSPADAEHAEYDARVTERQLARLTEGSDFVKQVVALIGSFEVVRRGQDLRVSVHATRAFSQYVLGTLERDASRGHGNAAAFAR
jgi:hypothetical protein